MGLVFEAHHELLGKKVAIKVLRPEFTADEDLRRIRPPIDGHDVMTFLKVPPGPVVGRALDHLLEIRLDRGEYTREEAFALLQEWARTQGLQR
jgi:poly(A) polymerase